MKKKLNKRRKSRGFAGEYKNCFYFLSECRYYILFTAGLFILFSLLVFFGLQSQELNKVLLEQLKNIILEFEGLSGFGTIVKIFINNLTASFFGIVFGVFFGIMPVVFIITNSYILGLVSRMAVEEEGVLSLWRLFPHGIFEFPAIIISFALGIKIGMFVFADNPWKELSRRFVNSSKVFLLIVVPLLIVAAVIEGVLVVVAG